MNRDLISKLINEPVNSTKEIDVGISNTNYLVNDKYIVRIKETREYFYRAHHERTILRKIASLKISPILRTLDDNGNMVSEYIPHAKIYQGQEKEVAITAKLLKKLHTNPVHFVSSFKPFKRYNYYQKNSGISKRFSHEKRVLKIVHHFYRHYRKVLCHNDVVSNNLLFTNATNYLIDYEFAGKNIPLFDLASFLSENEIHDKKQIELFLTSYGASDEEIRDLPYMMMFLNLLWYYWANERYLVTKKAIFQTIIEQKKAAIATDLRSLLIYK